MVKRTSRAIIVSRRCSKIGAFAGSQPGHGFPVPGGSRRTRKDTKTERYEFRRSLEET